MASPAATFTQHFNQLHAVPAHSPPPSAAFTTRPRTGHRWAGRLPELGLTHPTSLPLWAGGAEPTGPTAHPGPQAVCPLRFHGDSHPFRAVRPAVCLLLKDWAPGPLVPSRPFPGSQRANSSARSPGEGPEALHWWRLHEAKGCPGRTGLPWGLPRSRRLCLPSSPPPKACSPPPGPHPAPQPGSSTPALPPPAASSSAVGEGGTPPRFLGFLSGGPRGHPARMVRKDGHSQGEGRGLALGDPESQAPFPSRARTRGSELRLCACLPLALPGGCVPAARLP